MYRSPPALLSFGDIFEADHLIDVFLRSDAAAMGGAPLPDGLVQALARALNRELDAPGSGGFPIYSPLLPQRTDQHWVLGQSFVPQGSGKQRAILLTDDCAIDTVLGRDRPARRMRGRLLFAPIASPTGDEVERLRLRPVFGRFALPAHDDFGGGVAELRHCFMVDIRDVSADDRICSLGDELLDRLEAAWNAAIVRRGPLVTARNEPKLAQALAAGAEPDAQHRTDASLVSDALGAAWRAEGRGLGGVARAFDERESSQHALDTLLRELQVLADLASRAAERVGRHLAESSESGDCRASAGESDS